VIGHDAANVPAGEDVELVVSTAIAEDNPERAEARRRGLEWMHDPSNDDQRFARNLVRHRVMPLLAALNPAAAANLARSAAHLAEAQALLTGLGHADLDAGKRNGRVQVVALARVEPARARNALRVHLADAGVAPPSSRLLDELLRQHFNLGSYE
jgi:tRNA(Ile)-lysidine synthase